MPGTLTEGEIGAALLRLPGWERDENAIRKTFVFDGFPLAMEFVNAVAAEAEAADHHPDIDIRWNKVTLYLTTHSAGGLTQKDVDIAESIESILAGARRSLV
jgi:4a-hydroxytetrahydrobiopterin dehydratase